MSGALARARRILKRPGAWIDAATTPGRYQVRYGPDRRARVLAEVDEAAFQSLILDPGLRIRPAGGWIARQRPVSEAASIVGRPGMIEGDRTLMTPQGEAVTRRANLAQTAVAWLARRVDAEGRPWLTPAEVAAADHLAFDAEQALCGPSLTLRWDALPRARAGSSARSEPGDRQLAAGRRVEAALAACGPARPIIEAVVIRSSALQAAERDLGLVRRTGKRDLKAGLTALARHYGLQQ